MQKRPDYGIDPPGVLNTSFDILLSDLCIHNIPQQEGRDRACRDAAVLAGEGFAVAWRGPFWQDTFPPLKMFVARKPA